MLDRRTLIELTAAGLAGAGAPLKAAPDAPLHVYTLPTGDGAEAYDIAVAAATAQGIINRLSPRLYLLSPDVSEPAFWLDIMRRDGRWLSRRRMAPVADLDALVALGGGVLQGAVIWDPEVPASLNVATTLAGIHDAVVLSPDLADRQRPAWRLPVLHDLRGRFTGKETGSAKNDAYRWAIREVLTPGRCSDRRFCLFEDAFLPRAAGDLGYAIPRDWAVRHRAFVMDLSPFDDEAPLDDPGQPLGLDQATYRLILAEMRRHSRDRHMIEQAGFHALRKYTSSGGRQSRYREHEAEYANVGLVTKYNVYQNTLNNFAFNQSLHSHAPRRMAAQPRPAIPPKVENKTYFCCVMANYDSSSAIYWREAPVIRDRHGSPFRGLGGQWESPSRGRIPLLWGCNPNLIDNYPDIIAYFRETASAHDAFGSDASAAGYTHPSMIPIDRLPLFAAHNRAYFRDAGMTIANFLLDHVPPSPEVKRAYRHFATDGLIVYSPLWGKAEFDSHLWDGMPVMALNDESGFTDTTEIDVTARGLSALIDRRPAGQPDFRLCRIGNTVSVAHVVDTFGALTGLREADDFAVVDPYTFLGLFSRWKRRPAPVA